MADPVDPIRAALIEAMARNEHAYMEQFGTPGAKHKCPPSLHRTITEGGCRICDNTGFTVEGPYPSWEDEDENIKTMYRDDAERWLSVVESWTPTKPCPDCFVVNGVRYIELGGQPVPADGCPTCDGTSQVVSDVPGIIELLCEHVGNVQDVGGGMMYVWVRRDLPNYPEPGVPVYRLRERPDP